MKVIDVRKFALLALILFNGIVIQAQQKPSGEVRNVVTLNPNSGYVTINELSYGFGLGSRDLPYSGYFYGITTMHGYQLNRYGLHIDHSIQAGIATGFLMYNEGNLIPLYLDLRYNINHNSISPFIMGNGGLLISYSDFDQGTRIFIKGGGGLRYRVNERFQATLGAALQVQMGNGSPRDAFVTINAGIIYKPR